jgi:nicotinamide mononucleotide transporter
MLHLDYLSCALTILSTVMIGRRSWHGWLVAGVNSLIICWIGLHARQYGFIIANMFCLVMYAYNVQQWRREENKVVFRPMPVSDTLPTPAHERRQLRIRGREFGGAALEHAASPERKLYLVHSRSIPAQQ